MCCHSKFLLLHVVVSPVKATFMCVIGMHIHVHVQTCTCIKFYIYICNSLLMYTRNMPDRNEDFFIKACSMFITFISCLWQCLNCTFWIINIFIIGKWNILYLFLYRVSGAMMSEGGSVYSSVSLHMRRDISSWVSPHPSFFSSFPDFPQVSTECNLI